MYRPPDNDVTVPLTPKPLPGTKFGPPALPPPKDTAASQPAATTAGVVTHVDEHH
ncbi:hypothetical protein M3691_37745 [Paenibacillus elgii]|nr:hypothetical protein [Paenibacillus elgii]